MSGRLAPLSIARAGVVSVAGVGRHRLWDAVMAAQPLATAVTRYDVSDVSVRNAALVEASLWSALDARWPAHERSVQLCLAAVDDLLDGDTLAADTALFLGTSLGGVSAWEPWHRALLRGRHLAAPSCVGHADTAPALAQALGLRGEVVTVSTACTSSAAALMQAADAVRLGEVRQALVLGVDVLNRFVHVGFDRLGALTPDTLAPAPFAADRAGMWLGEAAAALLLTRDTAALARYLGGGAAGDGIHMTAPDRTGGGLYRAASRAFVEADIAPTAVAWVSAHATSTRFNDAMEAAGLRAVFGAQMPPVHGAKPVTGHTLGASGLLEVLLCVEVLRRKTRPPTHTRRQRDAALEDVPVDLEAAPLRGDVALTLNSAMAGHNTALLLGAP